MISFTVIANCQSGPLANILTGLSGELTWRRVKPIHLLTNADKAVFDSTLEEVNLVIHQPIGGNYKEFSINSIKNRFPNKIYISFPSLYFRGYAPWHMYLRLREGGVLKGPLGDYHDERIIRSYLLGRSVAQAVKELEDPNGDGDELLNIEFEKLSVRELELDVQSLDFIKSEFTKNKLFYVMNHPSNLMMSEIALRITRFLNLSISRNAIESVQRRPEYLRALEAPVDNVIKKFVDVKFQCDELYRDSRSGHPVTRTRFEFVRDCFELYERFDDFLNIYDFALERRARMEG
jgi:hypothetical protein